MEAKQKIHELKLVQPYFDDVWHDKKDFEVRKNDRDFKVGDRLCLLEVKEGSDFNPRFIIRDIKYILNGGHYGIEKGYVILGMKQPTF